MTIYQISILQSRKKINLYTLFINNYIQEIQSLTKRLFIQTIRRPSSILSGIIQPLLWLILFGGLFQNAPLNLANSSNQYGSFLSCGIIIFTAFTGALNSGLPLIFDREFGFLNRLLVTPLISKNTIILAATCFIICITMIQNLTVILCSLRFTNFQLNYYKIQLILIILLLITSSISNISIGLAFLLPGHIEFLAFTVIINLPMLFASTALAPLYFMPYWLQIISKLNILTYAIESIRHIITIPNNYFYSPIINILHIDFNLLQIMFCLLLTTLTSFIMIQNIVNNKLE